MGISRWDMQSGVCLLTLFHILDCEWPKLSYPPRACYAIPQEPVTEVRPGEVLGAPELGEGTVWKNSFPEVSLKKEFGNKKLER